MQTQPSSSSGSDPLAIDLHTTVLALCDFLRRELSVAPRHRGYVVGVSGGIDSAVSLALCVHALGPQRVRALLLPERESQPEGVELARELVALLGVRATEIDLTDQLESIGVYVHRENVVRSLFDEFDEGWRYRLILPGDLREHRAMNVYRVEIIGPDGTRVSRRPDASALRRLQAFTNVKQRLRMTHLYREAEEDDLLVCGTTNRTELELGFFVVHGDGGVDVEPLAGLYKQQVRALALELGVPKRIVDRPPAPDTWSAPVTDEEFYLRLDYAQLDAVLARLHVGRSHATIAREVGIDPALVDHVATEIARRAHATQRKRRLPPVPDLHLGVPSTGATR